MSQSRGSVPDGNKPIVGIIYSESILESAESRSFAFYLSGSLVSTGFAKVCLVGLRSDGEPCNLQLEYNKASKGSISFLPPGKSSVQNVKSLPVTISNGSNTATSMNSSAGEAQISFSHWNELQNCQVIIVVVNSNDTVACAAKLAVVLPDSLYRVVVFSLQRGVKNGGILKDGLRSVGVTSNSKNSSGVVVVEGIAAFACVPVPFMQSSSVVNRSTTVSGVSEDERYYFACTVRMPQIMLERLNKDIAGVADGPVNLLETIGIEIQFRKTLTPFSWGILIYENIYALNIVTGGDLRDMMKSRRLRLILGLMVRESRETLLKAAGNGKWAPEMCLIAFHLTPWMFEMALVAPLPEPFFRFFWAVLNVLAGCIVPWGDISYPGVRSPGVCDLLSGRRTMAEWHIAEIVSTAQRHKVDVPLCAAVLSTVRTLEASVRPSVALPPPSDPSSVPLLPSDVHWTDPKAIKGRMYVIDCAYSTVTGDVWYRHAGVWEASYRLLQAAAVLFLTAILMYEIL